MRAAPEATKHLDDAARLLEAVQACQREKASIDRMDLLLDEAQKHLDAGAELASGLAMDRAEDAEADAERAQKQAAELARSVEHAEEVTAPRLTERAEELIDEADAEVHTIASDDLRRGLERRIAELRELLEELRE
jgi:hypothetical protein